MIDPATLHADLLAYCARIGVAPTTFGQWVVRDFAFAASLRSGTAKVGKVRQAQRFMRDNPDVPNRQFGAVAKAWRDRVAQDGGGDGSSGGAEGAADQAADPSGDANGNGAAFTDALLEENPDPHNQESQEVMTAGPASTSADPAAVARILETLGGHEAVATGARIAVTSLEAMQAEGVIWRQHHRELAALAREAGFELDAERLTLRPIRAGRAA